MLQGIDISHHQGAVNWKRVHTAGMEFAYIKATQGSAFTDPRYSQNRAEAKAAGLLVGSYHYWQPGVHPLVQARHFRDVVGSVPKGELQPVLDIEENGDTAPSLIIRQVRTWVEGVKDAFGRDPIIYTYPHFWRYAMQDSDNFHDLALWIAHYTKDKEPTTVGSWPRWSFWQYTSTGRVAGVQGRVDRNRFNGYIDQLQRFAGLP